MGAVVNNGADRGIFVTTSTFSAPAMDASSLGVSFQRSPTSWSRVPTVVERLAMGQPFPYDDHIKRPLFPIQFVVSGFCATLQPDATEQPMI